MENMDEGKSCKKMTKVRMSTRGRLTIPKKIRDELGLKPGNKVTFTAKQGYILMQLAIGDFEDQMGRVSVEGRQDFDEIRKEVKRRRGTGECQ